MARAKLYGIIQVFQLFLAVRIQLQPIVSIRPTLVGERKAREVESPFRKQREVTFLERRVAAVSFHTFVGQIKSTPARQAGGGRFRQVLGVQRQERSARYAESKRRGVLKKLSAVHNLLM